VLVASCPWRWIGRTHAEFGDLVRGEFAGDEGETVDEQFVRIDAARVTLVEEADIGAGTCMNLAGWGVGVAVGDELAAEALGVEDGPVGERGGVEVAEVEVGAGSADVGEVQAGPAGGDQIFGCGVEVLEEEGGREGDLLVVDDGECSVADDMVRGNGVIVEGEVAGMF
jgi:hypothetical protein